MGDSQGLEFCLQTWSMTTGREEYDRVWAIDVRGTFDVGRRFAPLINQGEDLAILCLAVQNAPNLHVLAQHSSPATAIAKVAGLGRTEAW